MSARPNIVFIFSDQHRHDVMGCAGHRTVQTPNLDALAARGQRFTKAWCQSPICQPSRASLITGQHPYDLGVFYNDASSATHASTDLDDAGEIDPSWPTFMKQLQAVGYETATIGKTHYHGIPTRDDVKAAGGDIQFADRYDASVRAFGWDYVLEEYDKYVHSGRPFRTPYANYLDDHGLLDVYRQQIRGVFRLTPSHWRGETSVVPQEHDLTTFLADRSIEWLQHRDDSNPFLLKLAFVQPHVPLIDDPTWAAYYADADIEVPDLTPPEASCEEWARYLGLLAGHSQQDTMSADFVREGIRHYYGMVSLIDQQIGAVMAALEANGQLDNTWIIYSCDHGEMLGTHSLWAKMNFYQGSAQVPLIITPPQGGSGTVDDTVVELTDVAATITDIAGTSAPAGCRGRSLLPRLRGDSSTERDYAYSRIQSYAALRTDRFRFTMEMRSGAPCELFDMLDDPDETTNLVNDPARASMVGDLKSALTDLQET
jgi:arylsulfatase A-like enzyme